MEKLTIEELPFTFPLLERMKENGLTIKRLKGEHSDYYYLTSSSIHQVYSFNGESHILISDLHLNDVMEALDNDRFRLKVLNYMVD